MRNPLSLKLSVATSLDSEDEALLDRLTQQSFSVARKTDLIEEGDDPEDVHLIMEGFACRYKLVEDGRRQILALLMPGDFCDLHVALLREMDHSIATLSPCKVVRISRDTVDELIQHHPRLTRALWWATLVDESILRENIAGLGQRETDQQMAHLFCELHARLGTVGLVQDDAFDLPLTQEELGDMLGVSIVHTNRTLMDLRARNLVDFHKGRVTIIALDHLAAFAGFRANYLHLSGVDAGTERKQGHRKGIFVGATSQSRARLFSDRASGQVSHGENGSMRSVRAMFMDSSKTLTERRVLVVEDEYFAAEEMTAAVRNAGARVVGPVASVEDALALIRRGEAIDAAILDINLSGRKVFPVAKALAEHSIPLVFVTGYDDWMIPSDYEDVPIFRKPTDPANVVRTLFAR